MTSLKKAEAQAVALRTNWLQTARKKQLKPTDKHFIWLILAGRGWGKKEQVRKILLCMP